ncbi:MAG: hypothetical protein HYV78_00220 [Candidatus Wildermuthbacteria bacterium]|nr:hypothetical protein [Candidatus Wildermuthbacteria bacterium]
MEKLILFVWTAEDPNSQAVQDALRALNAREINLSILLATKPTTMELIEPGALVAAWQKATQDV